MLRKGRLCLVLCVSVALALVLCGCSSAKIPDEYDYDDLSKYIELGKYKNLEYEKYDTEVTQHEVMEYIYKQMDSNKQTEEVKSGTVTKDSIAVIDYDGRYKGKQIDGAYAEGVSIDMSTNDYLPDFMNGILGRKVGETFTMQVVFPENYADEYAGKTIDFTVTIHSLMVTKTPEYNDSYVKKNTEYSSTKEYEKAVKKQLSESKKAEASDSDELELFNTILENSKLIKCPKKEYEARYNSIVETYKAQAKDYDSSFEKYLKEELGVSKEEFYKEAKESAESAVKQELILHQIARNEDISITRSEYNDYLDELLEGIGSSKSEYKKQSGMSIEEYAEKNNLYSSLLYKKVMEKVKGFSKAR